MVFKKIKKKAKLLLVKWKIVLFYRDKISFSNPPERKQVIIVFDGNFQHGGLVDRLKGIVSFYQIAQKANADFKLYFKHPFGLDLFLQPNLYDWYATEDDLKWNPLSTEILYLMDDFKANPKDRILNSPKKKFIVYCNIDYSATIHPNSTPEEQQALWGQSFTELFKRSDYLNTEISALSLEDNRIAIHTRFTSILGDFKDTTAHVVSDQRKEEIKKRLKEMLQEIALENPSKTMYVFSDSIHFLQDIRQNTSYKVIEGEPKHIDFDKHRKIDKEDHLKTFIDFFAIAGSEKVFLLKTEEMHNSAFGKYAAVIGGSEFKIMK